jgi:hypothetical protein
MSPWLRLQWLSPVVVIAELFTSEGCSGCPAADDVLSQLAPQPTSDVEVPLSEHVDYWDRLGWRDPFSSLTPSNRQSNYARVFYLNEVYTRSRHRRPV